MGVESKIVINISAIVNGLADVRALGISVQGIGTGAKSTAAGMSTFDASLTRSQRTAAKLSTELRQLQRELDALNAKIKRDGQFAVPSDLTRVQALTESIAQRERALNEQNHLAAVSQIKEQRQAILAGNEADRQDIRKNFDEVTKQRQAADEDFDKRIAQRVAKRKSEQQVIAAGIENEVKGVSRLSRLAEVAVSPFRRIGTFLVGIFQQIIRQIEFMIAAFVIFAASSPALIFGLLVKEGIAFNSVMEQARIGLAALLQSTQLIFNKDQPNKPLQGIEAFTAASKIAEEVTNRLQIKLIPLKATSEELIPIFNQIITAAAGAGLNILQTEDTFISLAAAAQILQVPLERLGTEIRLLLSGTTRETSRLGPALFGSAEAAREFVKEHRAIGDLFPALQTKLAAYNTALLVSTSSFAVLAENAKEVFQRLSALATSTLFDKIKQGLIKITQSFFDLNAGKIKPEFEALFAFLNTQLGRLGDKLNDLVDKVIGYLSRIATYVQQNQRYLQDILSTLGDIAKQLGGILGDLISVIAAQDEARAKAITWKTVLELVAATIAAIRDEMKIVIGAFQALAGVIIVAILFPLEKVAEVLGLISEKAAEAAVNLHNARLAAQGFAEAGKDRFVEGATFGTTRAEIEAQNARDREPDTTGLTFRKFIPGRNTADQNKGLDFRPNPNATGAGKGAGGSGDKTLNRLGELAKRTAELLRDLYKTRIEIERAGEDRSFNITKTASDNQLNTLNDNLKHRLISTLDYYKEKSRIETAAIQAEKVHLLQQFKFDERETIAAIDAISSEFDAQGSEPKNKDARLQAELSKQRQIKIGVETNKLEEKRVKLNGSILELDQKQVETNRQNNVGLEDGLDTLRKVNEQVQEQLLDAQGRTTAAEIRRIAEQYKDELLTVLTESNPATDALTQVIENIKQLGNVTSQQLLSILDQAGLKFGDLSDETKALISLIQKLEGSAIFKGLQTEVSNKLGGLDLKSADIQDKVNQGVISEAKGRHEVALAEQEVRFEIEKVITLMEQLPGLTDAEKLALARVRQEASQMGREVDEFGSAINDAIKNDLSAFGDSLIDDFRNIGANVKKLFLGIASDIGKTIIRVLVLQRLFQALGLNNPGTTGPGSAGGLGGILSGWNGRIDNLIGHKDGGYVDGPTGATDGLLRRLTRGEWVIPAASVKRVGTGVLQSINTGNFNRLGTPQQGQTGRTARQLPPIVVFAMSEEEIAKASMGRAGQEVFVHHWKRNAKSFGVA